MIRKITIGGAILLLTTVMFLITRHPGQVQAQDDPRFEDLGVDVDRDGLDADEEAALGTDPFNSDSDGDGLDDGQENLFGTDPNDERSPGIYVEYDLTTPNEGYQTADYFDTVDNPDPYLDKITWLENPDGTMALANEAFVVRRGDTLVISGPPGAMLTIEGVTKSNPGGIESRSFTTSASDLSYTPHETDVCNGGWEVAISPDAKVGEYKATLSRADWGSDLELPIYVIFEIPETNVANDFTTSVVDDANNTLRDEINTDDILAFLYDEETERDERAIWFMTRQFWYDSICDEGDPQPCTTRKPSGITYNQTAPNGQSAPIDYAYKPYYQSYGYAIAYRTHQYSERVFLNTTLPAIHGASDQETALGDLSDSIDRDVKVNYSNYYDKIQSTFEVLDSFGTGTIPNSVKNNIGAACQDNAAALSGLTRGAGILSMPFLTDYYSRNYAAYNKFGVSTGEQEKWYNQNTTNGWFDHSILAWVNNSSDFEWKISRGFGEEERGDANWPFDNGNTNTRSSNNFISNYRDDRGDLLIRANSDWQFDADGGIAVNEIDTGNYEWNQPLFEGLHDYLWDNRCPLEMQFQKPGVEVILRANAQWDNNGPVVEWGQTAYGFPNSSAFFDPSDDWTVTPIVLSTTPRFSACSAGSRQQEINRALAQGDSDDSEFAGDNLDASAPTNTVGSSNRGALLIEDSFRTSVFDADGDGLNDSLAFEVDLDIAQAGEYEGAAHLYDGDDNWLGYATARTTGSTVRLEFNDVLGVDAYVIRDLFLRNGDGLIMDFESEPINKQASLGPVQINPNNLSYRGADSNRNGLYDQLFVNVPLNVNQASAYSIAAWLTDPFGNPVAFARSEPQNLDAGARTLTVPFSGYVISGSGASGPYTLQKVQVYLGDDTSRVVAEMRTLDTTISYRADQFESQDALLGVRRLSRDTRQSNDYALLFEDNDADNSLWQITTNWISDSGYWQTDSDAASLQTESISLLDSTPDGTVAYVRPVVRINSCHALASNQTVTVGAELDGLDKGTAFSLSDERSRWATRVIDLDSLDITDGVDLRLLLETDVTGDDFLWRVDEIEIFAWPVVTEGFIDASQVTVSPGDEVTFEANYQPDPPIGGPLEFTWDFGDGTVPVTTDEANIVYTFSGSTPDEPDVSVTITNLYGSVTVTRSMSEGKPPTGFDIDFSAAESPIANGDEVTFSLTNIEPSDVDTLRETVWRFGDGTTITCPSASENCLSTTSVKKSYANGGDYTVQATLSNDFGQASAIETIDISEAVASTTITLDNDSPVEGDIVSLTAEHTPDTASTPLSYQWTINSSPVSTNAKTIELVLPRGNNTIAVDVSNDVTTAGSVTDTLAVEVGAKPITSLAIDFDADSDDSAGQTAVFSATYGPVDASQPITYTWNFGDGSTVTTNDPTVTYRYNTPGGRTVQVTADNGAETTISAQTVVTTPFDSDGDGLTNLEEIELGLDPNNPDTDGDDLTDSEELNGYIYLGYVDHPAYNTLVTTDPTNPDTDGDGVFDGEEILFSSHPDDIDTDDDGLTDGEESGTTGSSSPIDPDSDDDGLTDFEEVVLTGTSPTSSDSEVNDDGIQDESVHDGISDCIEVGGEPIELGDGSIDCVGGNLNNPIDTDGDGIIDAIDTDSDNDGILDDAEYYSGFPDALLCSNNSLEGNDDDGDGEHNCQDNDVDEDGLPNYRDTNSDNDSANDEAETGDADKNGTVDFLQFSENAPSLVSGVTLSANPTIPAPGDAVTFAASIRPGNAQQPISYEWNINGTVVGPNSSSSTSFTFDAIGDYLIIVTATNTVGSVSQSVTDTLDLTVAVNPLTGIDLIGPTYAIVGEVVDLTTTLTPTNATTPISYTWTVNNDSPVVNLTGIYSQTFNSDGTYTVQVVASNGYGEPVSDMVTIKAGVPISTASLSYAPETVAEGDTVNFVATITPTDATAPISYTWHVGDFITTTVDTLTLDYTFEEDGLYPLELTIDNGYGMAVVTDEILVGQPVRAVTVTVTPTSTVQGEVLTFSVAVSPTELLLADPPLHYVWTFFKADLSGVFTQVEQLTSTQVITTRSYTQTGFYSVTVQALNEYGSVTGQQLFTVTGRPLEGLTLTLNETTFIDGETLVLTATAFPDTAALPINYFVNFGDGTPVKSFNEIDGYQINTRHEWATVGNRTIIVTATNGFGDAVVTETVIFVDGRPILSVTLTSPNLFPEDGEVVNLFSSISPSEATGPYTFTWNFGDGSEVVVNQQDVISHVYGVGSFTAIVTVTNGYGSPQTQFLTVEIDGNGVDTASYEYGLTADGLTVIFTATHTPDIATPPVSYEWNFGHEGIETTRNLTLPHTFPTSDTYQVILTATNAYDSASYSQLIRVPLDTDGDGLSDLTELAVGTDLNNVDSDGDGLSDGLEVQIGSNPLSQDSDGDGISDLAEVGVDVNSPPNSDVGTLNADGLIDALDNDSDGDGLPDAAEYDPDQNQSTDGDLCEDLTLDQDIDGIPNCQDNDVDGDGLLNYVDTDSDNDALPDNIDNDLPDMANNFGTNPYHPDSDGDGMLDGYELRSDEDTDGDGLNNALDVDSDGDGLSDADEHTLDQSNIPVSADCTNEDADELDGDGILDCLDNNADNDELDNFRDWDSDNDTISDSMEYPSGTGRVPTNRQLLVCSDTTTDQDEDGIPNCEDVDVDGDGLPNHLDLDSDGDGIADSLEALKIVNPDGTADYISCTTEALAFDTDTDGIPDCQDVDVDGDGLPNQFDLDSDGDDIADETEGAADVNNNGLPDFLDQPGVPSEPLRIYLPVLTR